MLELAIPISGLFKEELAAKNIIRSCDCLECRDWCIKSDYPRQYLIHFEANIVQRWTEEERNYIYSSILLKTELKQVTFHLTTSYEQVTIKDGMFYPQGPQIPLAQLFLNAADNIVWLRSFLRKNILIGIENNNYYPTPAYEHVTDGDFITKVVKENDVWLVFDLAHARITAINKRMNYEDYRNSLPLDRAIQLHISKHGLSKDGIAYDAHQLPDGLVFEEVCMLVREFPIRYLTIEYYQDAEKLIQALGDYKQLKMEYSKNG